MLALADRPSLIAAIEARLDQLDAYVAGEEARVEDADATGPDVERANAALVRAKDVLWALRRDRLRTAAAVSDLAGRERRPRARWPASSRCSWRCRPSTASRCGAGTRPACTCSCGTTGSTSTTPS